MGQDDNLAASGLNVSIGAMTDSTPKAQSRYTMHFDRFILSVDNQRKASFTDRKDAMAEGERITKAYPAVKVAVIDSETGEETTLSGGVGFV